MDKTLPEGWEIRQLLECIEKDASSNKLKIPQSDFQDKGEFAIIDQSTKYIAGYTDNPLKVYTGELPVIIFGDHTRIFKFVDFPFSLGADGTKILAPKKNLLNPKYFYFFLRKLRIKSHGYSRHYKFLKEKQILIPPRQTQNKIVLILEKAEGTKKIRAEANQLTNNLIQSVFVEMFGDPVRNPKGWEIRKFGDICKINMGQSPTGESYNKSGTGTPLLNGPTEFGDYHPTPLQWTDKPTKICDIGNILFCVRGATAGRMNWADQKYCIGRGLVAIQTVPKLSENQYIYQFLLMNYERFQDTGIGSTFINISRDKLKNLDVPLPPIELQNKFSQISNKVATIQENQLKSDQQIYNISNTIMQKAFKGELPA